MLPRWGRGHHGTMSSDSRAAGAGRLVGWIPRPIRVGLGILWVVAAMFAKWDGVNGHALTPVYWAFVSAGVAVLLVEWLSHFLVTFGDADRAPIERLPDFLLFTGGLLGFGVWAILDGAPLLGGVLLLAGLVLGGLLARHMLKPVRRGAGPSSPWRAKGPW